MKAKEYFDKYFAELANTKVHLTSAEVDKRITENAVAMYRDFLQENMEMVAKRNPQTVDGIVAIARELNDKWNSVASKVNSAFGVSIIKRNVIWNECLCRPSLGWGFQRKPEE
jgi:flagellin-specific chaperone FliS